MSEGQEYPKTASSRLALPDLNAMKKAILTEIGGVTEEDLNVMSASEIEEFYKQLAGTMVDEDKKTIDNPSKSNDPEPQKANQQIQTNKVNEQKSDKSAQIAEHQQNIVTINGSQYFRPKFLDGLVYSLSNNKLLIYYGQEVKNLQQKTIAVCSAYNPSMSHVVRSMRPQQIQDTYQRLRMPENKNKLVVPINLQIPTFQFCLYIQPAEVDRDLSYLEERKPILKQKSKEIQSKNKPNQMETKEVNNIEDQFFNQASQNSIKKDKQKQMKRQIVRNVSSKPSTSLKNPIHQVKNKQIIQTSAQTESIPQENIKTKTKITILNQIQYVEDTDEQQELRPQPRLRLFDNDDQINKFPHKLNLEEFRKALQNPGPQPQTNILLWIQDMKNLVNQFENNYLNQFKTDWNFIND